MSEENKTARGLNVIMLGHKSIPSRDGGIDVVVQHLSETLVEKGNSVTVINRKRKRACKTENNGVKICQAFTVNKRSLDAIIYSFFATLKAKRIAEKEKVDAIHFHAEGVCAFIGLLPKRKKRNYKVVVTVHGLDWKRAKWKGLGSKVIKSCEKKIVKYADEIIVLNGSDEKYFKDAYGRETTLIPNATDTPNFVPPSTVAEKYGLKKDGYVLCVARLVPEKGILYLANAFKKLQKENAVDKKLVIVGSYAHSDYSEKVETAVKGEKNIIMTGFLEGKELSELYSNAYLFCLPSDVEGMSMSLLEARAYGNVCLVSDIPENVSVIGDRDYTFRRGDTDDLAERLKEIMAKNPSFEKIPAVLHAWNEIAERTVETYKS